MTAHNETTKDKQTPAFYIFDSVEIDGKKENRRIGAAFAHRTGSGFNLVINGKRYAAFSPKPKTAGDVVATTEGKGA